MYTRRKLEKLLKSIGCDLRTWYQQLTGNQARALLREENIDKFLDIFPPDSSINIQPMKIVMLSLSKLMSSANNKIKSDEEIEELERVLDDFVTSLKLAQPNATVTPKLHILTAHLIPFLKKHRTWGSITEQGVEHLHAIINGLNSRLASVLNTTLKASLIVKALSNYNFIFDVGLSWFKVE